MKNLLIFLVLAGVCFGQAIPPAVGVYSLMPGSSSSGGSTAFSAITSGTNTSAAMVVGSGASLDFTGTGTINAKTLLGISTYGRTDQGNTWTGVNTFGGAFIRTPATITVTAGAGTIDVTKGYSQASVSATTTLTPSAAGSAGQFLTLDIICDSTSRVITVDTASDFTVTAPASLTTTILMRSDGSGWILVGGSPSAVDLAANTTPASTQLIATTNPTTGAVTKSTISEVATTVRGTVVEKIAVFVVNGGGSAVTTGTVAGTSTVPFACTLTAWSITGTAASGTNTVKFWNVATGTAIPTIANVINTSGVSLTTGTAVKSATLTDFTDTTYAAFDMFRCAVTAVDGTATDLTITLYGTRL